MAKKKASTGAVNTIRLNSISFYRLRSLGFFELLYQAVAAELGSEQADSRALYRLFPQGPAKQAARYAGLPRPTSCI